MRLHRALLMRRRALCMQVRLRGMRLRSRPLMHDRVLLLMMWQCFRRIRTVVKRLMRVVVLFRHRQVLLIIGVHAILMMLMHVVGDMRGRVVAQHGGVDIVGLGKRGVHRCVVIMMQVMRRRHIVHGASSGSRLCLNVLCTAPALFFIHCARLHHT